jgi:hypothetical protein
VVDAEPDAPSGGTIVAAVSLIGGLAALLGLLLLMSEIADEGIPPSQQLSVVATGILAITYVVLSIAFAFGLSSMRMWAWPVGVTAQFAAMLSSGLAVFQGGVTPTEVILALGRLVFPVAILMYLFRANVRSAFGRR